MTQHWHYEFCPACGISGVVHRSEVVAGDTFAVRTETCEVCDGTGRIKVPHGFTLISQPIRTVSVYSSANTQSSDPEAGDAG